MSEKRMKGSAKRDAQDPGAMTSGATQVRRNGAAHASEPSLDRAVQAQIGSKLRAMYGELVEQPVPDRLTAILGRLDSLGQETAQPASRDQKLESNS